ncbi:MAG: fibronectin type III domain-containing protein [Candidatus Dojkabacteria bacterium]
MSPKNRKLFYILIFVALILLVPIAYFAFNYVRDLRSDASTEAPPKNIQIYNPLSNSFDVAWTTDIPATGSVMYGANAENLTSEGFDIRGAEYEGLSHVVVLRGLEPESTYYFKIISNGKETTAQEFKTSKVISTEPINLYGSTESSSADSLIRAFLIEKGSGKKVDATMLGSVILDNGTWTMDAGNFRTGSGEKVSNFANYLLQVEIIDKDGVVIARELSPEIESSTEIVLETGKIADSTAEATKFVVSTTRVPATSPTGTNTTPAPTGTTAPTQTSITVSNVEIVNILDGTFAVVWETNVPTNSYVRYSINGGASSVAFDKRSNSKLARSLRTHFVEITDTTNPAGTKYEITLINNESPWKEKVSFEKVAVSEVPSIDSVPVSFKKSGNYIDQVLVAEVKDKSTKIAVTSDLQGNGVLELSSLRDIENPSEKYDVLDSDVLEISFIGGTLKNIAKLESMTIDELREEDAVVLDATPKDTAPFQILYINIKNGEVIKELRPEFAGEGFKPNSTITIEIEKQ